MPTTDSCKIEFELTGLHATMLRTLHEFTQRSPHGPKFKAPSDLAASLLRAVLEDDANDATVEAVRH
jgi:hypothetical protein